MFGGQSAATGATSVCTFGAQPAATGTTGGSLFGGAQTSSAPSGQQQSGQVVPAATVDASKLTPTTRFGDCHQSVQQELESIEYVSYPFDT